MIEKRNFVEGQREDDETTSPLGQGSHGFVKGAQFIFFRNRTAMKQSSIPTTSLVLFL